MTKPPEEFKYLIARSIEVARQRIEGEDQYAKISDEACDRALNILSYAFELPDLWSETRELLLTMVPKMEMAGHRGDWIPYLEKGIAIGELQNDHLGSGEVYLAMGYLEFLRSDFETAQTSFSKSLNCCQLAKDLRGQGKALNRLGLVAEQQGRYQKAFELAQSALELLSMKDAEQANSFYILGSIARHEQKWQTAEGYLTSSLYIWQADNDKRRIAWGYRNLGPVFRAQKKFDEAEQCYNLALEIFDQLHDPINQAMTKLNLGNIYRESRKAHDAIELYHQARNTFGSVQDTLNLARTCVNLGNAHFDLEEWEQAERLYKMSIEHWEEIKNIRSLCNAIDGLGETYLRQQKYSKAIQVLKKGLYWFTQMDEQETSQYLYQRLLNHIQEAEIGDGNTLAT
ncbi:MAG: tetratricopeptide repeat protein [Chloroflexota bacterium]